MVTSRQISGKAWQQTCSLWAASTVATDALLCIDAALLLMQVADHTYRYKSIQQLFEECGSRLKQVQGH